MVVLCVALPSKLHRECLNIKKFPHKLQTFFVIGVNEFHLLESYWIQEQFNNLHKRRGASELTQVYSNFALLYVSLQ